MRSVRGACVLAVLVAAGWLVADVKAVHLRGRILSVGFSSSDPFEQDQGYFHYKVGCWVPVRIDLTNDDGDLFNGWIEVRQPDGDGDPVVARQEVSIRDSRTYFLYVPGARNARDAPFNIRVFSKLDGSLVPLFNDRNERVIDLEAGDTVRQIPPTSVVILDISEGGLNHLDPLAKAPRTYEKLIVARCAPAELPDLVAGLDMADVIVWDAADPTAIDLHQRQALIEWTRCGGTLVLGVSKNWDTVNRSAFGELLPAKLREPTQTRTNVDLPTDARNLLFGTDTEHPLRYPLSYCRLQRNELVRGANSIVPQELPDSPPDERVLAASCPCGRGNLVLVAVEMRDLFKVVSYSEPFLYRVTLTREAAREDQSQSRDPYGRSYTRDMDLHALHVDKTTAFEVTAGLYFLFAFAFVVAYIVVATVGSWTWLKKQGRIRYSWVAFGALSVAASATSLLAVRLVRGIGNTVEAFTVVDGQAGSTEAGAICFLGLKTATYSNLDLSLPANWLDIENSPETHASLRPRSPVEGMVGEGTYKATAEYAAVPFAGQLHDVLFRATAKQFLGRWEGSMAGRLEANLLRKNPTELTDESWIENKLGTDLDYCYLFISARGFDEKKPRRMDIYCYPLSKLPDGKRITIAAALADLTRKSDQSGTRTGTGTGLEDVLESPRPRETRTSRMLGSIAGWRWAYDIKANPTASSMDETARRDLVFRHDAFSGAMLLLTFFDELNVDRDDAFRRLDRSEGRILDRSLAVTRDTALFVGFGENAGPARLCWRRSGSTREFRPIEPSVSRTMYRISIPVKPTGGQ